MTHPGVGPLTALAYVLIIGTPERFTCAKQISNYVGLIPSEDSSGGTTIGTHYQARQFLITFFADGGCTGGHTL